MNTITKKTRGRPRGSFSFVNVTLAELNAKYNQTETIPVGRLWLQGKSSMVPLVHVATPTTQEKVIQPDHKIEMSLTID